ncbi:MAG: molybdopterin-dependent oxidoreductase [Deltaproteobacteria bacterium]|nr:molybdopterin-dependent oxidoreductase [Deltaproteobacteria bacterium]
MSIFKTHCARMDHGGCLLSVTVEDNKIVKIAGAKEGFLNKGYICQKGLASAEKLTHQDRLLYPLKRVGARGENRWRRISWEEALGEIAANFLRIKADYGARAVAFCVGMPKGLEHFLLIRLANIFGSPNVVASQDVCHAPREITGLHTCGFYPVVDLHHRSELLMLWGSNATATNEEGEICSLLIEQVKSGTKLIVIDPRRTSLAKRADHWLRVLPGGDCLLALGMINVIISEGLYDKNFVENWTIGFAELAAAVREYSPENIAAKCGVDAPAIRLAARAYAEAKPAGLHWGNAIEHLSDTFSITRALICLMAICGNLAVPGGNVEANDPPIMGLGKFVRADLIPDKRKEMISNHYGVIPRLMTVAPAYFRRAIVEEVPYPVKAAYIMCANPVVNYADTAYSLQAFAKLDFIVCADVFLTPTAALADIVLPVATQYEINDIGHYGLGHGYVLARPKVVEPPAECRPDGQIINELGKLISDPQLWHENHEDFLTDLLAPTGISYEEFVKVGYLKGDDSFWGYRENGFKTPSKKVELALSVAQKFGLDALPVVNDRQEATSAAFPLLLTTAKSEFYLHSSCRQLPSLRKHSPFPTVEISRSCATKYGIGEGEEVLIHTAHGSITQTARFNDDLYEGVVVAASGWWFPEDKSTPLFALLKANYNALTSVKNMGKEYATPNLRAIPCRIEPARG